MRRLSLLIAAAAGLGCTARSPVPEAPLAAPPSLSARVPPLESPGLVDEVRRLREELARMAGEGAYIVIDTVHNRLSVRTESGEVRRAACATGSGKVLLGDGPGQTWDFRTPRRVFRVQRKVRDPVWKKPLWAFVEQNEKAPALPWAFSRLDDTTLGRYALELEDSYAIHGTLYPGLLGRHITHGCVRLGDEDLEAAFAFSRVGTPVYVY